MQLNNFKKKLICWGAGDQAIVLEPIIKSLGAKYDILIDDTPKIISPFDKIECLQGKDNFEKWLIGRNCEDYGFIVAIGNPFGYIRCKIHDYLISKNISPISICDPSALLDYNVIIEEGAQIMKGAIINAHARIGKQSIVNTGSIIEHHVNLEYGTEIGPGSTLCGRVTVKKYTWICSGVTILPRLKIGKNSIVGAGAVVTKDIANNSIYAGVPASFIKPMS